MKMKWINSAGGPFVLLAEGLMRNWRGGFAVPDAEGPSDLTDYDRACAVSGYAGVVAVPGGVALVLGDEPMQTAWLPAPSGDGGVFVRWRYADGEDELLRHLASVPIEAFSTEDFRFLMPSPRAYLFDAAIPGAQAGVDERLEVIARPGSYAVLTAQYMPNDRTSMVLNRLLKVG